MGENCETACANAGLKCNRKLAQPLLEAQQTPEGWYEKAIEASNNGGVHVDFECDSTVSSVFAAYPAYRPGDKRCTYQVRDPTKTIYNDVDGDFRYNCDSTYADQHRLCYCAQFEPPSAPPPPPSAGWFWGKDHGGGDDGTLPENCDDACAANGLFCESKTSREDPEGMPFQADQAGLEQAMQMANANDLRNAFPGGWDGTCNSWVAQPASPLPFYRSGNGKCFSSSIGAQGYGYYCNFVMQRNPGHRLCT